MRSIARILTAVAMLATLTFVAARPAAAIPVGSLADLQMAMDGCRGEEYNALPLELTADIASAAVLSIPCWVSLDLAGHRLDVAGVYIVPGQGLYLNESSTGGLLRSIAASEGEPGISTTDATFVVVAGSVEATGAGGGAGIGGGSGQSGGTVAVYDGTVVATGFDGAGIGGGAGSSSGGHITIWGGTVVASGVAGAGIGGGSLAKAGTVEINGGEVTATSTTGAGIGGGLGGNGGTITITGAIVSATSTASGDHGGAGIGGGAGSPFSDTDPYPGGGADLHIGSPAEVTARGGHTAVGGGTDRDGNKASFGSLLLEGLLRVPEGQLFVADGLDDEVTISASGRVEGTSDDPTVGAAIVGDGQIFNGGSITLATPLVRAGEVQVLFHNHQVSFEPAGGSPDPDPITVFAPTFSQGERSLPAGPARTGFEFVGWHTAADGGGELVDGSTELIGLSPDGEPTIQLVYAAWAPEPEPEEPGAVSSLVLETTAAEVPVGGSVTIKAAGLDEQGNPLGDVTDEVTLESDVPSDVVDGSTVTFPTASPHTITATHTSGVTASITIEVTAASVAQPAQADQDADTLPRTGSPIGIWVLTGALLLGVGGALGRVGRRLHA